MLDETDFRLGLPLPTGPMRVQPADTTYKAQKEQPLAADPQAKRAGTKPNRDRQKVIRKNAEMNNRLADWDDDDPQALPETASNRWDKVVVLKHMFAPAELAADATLALELKEDIREECEKLGPVTNVTVYDREEAGVVTVRFANAVSAREAVRVFEGRWFDKRRVEAGIADGRERFRKSRRGEVGDAEEEERRLEQFSRDIEGGREGEGEGQGQTDGGAR